MNCTYHLQTFESTKAPDRTEKHLSFAQGGQTFPDRVQQGSQVVS